MRIISLTDPKLQTQVLAVLAAGGLVIFPTETVYGALVDATNQTAVNKLLTYKKRPPQQPLSIACSDQKMAEKYAILNEQAQKIYSTLLPGPVTVISASRGQISHGVASEFGTLGIRLPAFPPLLNLIATFGRPVTATSANSRGRKTPYTLDDVFTYLSPKQKALIDLAVDAGTLPKNPPSLILDTTTSTPMVLRKNYTIDHNFDHSSTSFITHSVAETQALAGKIVGQHWKTLIESGLILALDGPLGAGKTTFTGGIGQFLSIHEPLTSPTYTYLKEYHFCKFDHCGLLLHLDAWTIDQAATFTLLEPDTWLKPGNLIIIEWFANLAPFFESSLPLLHLSLKTTSEPDAREIILSTPSSL